jgi:DNA-binding CsgD family transcriptional regulator
MLTKRQAEIVVLIAKGLRTKEIAQKIGVSEGTVDSHRAAIRRKTRFASLVVLAAGLSYSQSLTLAVSPTSVPPGGTATLSIGFTDAAPSANIAGIQWLVQNSGVLNLGAPAIGAAGLAAGKILTCAATNLNCLMIGSGSPLNTTALASGVIATVPITVPPGTSLGTVPISFSGGTTASTTGAAVQINAAASITLTVGCSIYDLNCDGTVNVADVLLGINQVLAGICTGSFVAVGSGKCQLSDVELVIEAALGQIH